MMKKLLFLLLTVWLTFPTYATPLQTLVANRVQRVRRAPIKNIIQSNARTPRQVEIIRALFREKLRPARTLTWEQFEEETVQYKQDSQAYIEKVRSKIYDVFDTDCKLYHKIVLSIPFYGHFRPDYANETRKAKYIYVTDASSHDTKTIPKEVSRVLSATRQAQPDARILLATEFAVVQDAFKAPIHFAGEQSIPFAIPEEYDSLLPLADRLNIDILSLDDDIIKQDDTNYNAIKVGDALVDFDPFSLPQSIRKILAKYDADWEQLSADLAETLENHKDIWTKLYYLKEYPDEVAKDNNFSPQQIQTFITELEEEEREYNTYLWDLAYVVNIYVADFLKRSNWGVRQRNVQWANYIKAISEYYDVIIVYGGSGHLNEEMPGTVPEEIGEPYVLFNFYTKEQLPSDLEQLYQNAEQICLEEFGNPYTTNDVFQREDIQRYNQEFIDLFDIDSISCNTSILKTTPPPGADTHVHVFFIKFVTNSHLSPEEKVRFNIIPSITFDVYLPDESATSQ